MQRKNSWGLAEQAGGVTSDGLQRLPDFYRWNAGEMRDDPWSTYSATLVIAAGSCSLMRRVFCRKAPNPSVSSASTRVRPGGSRTVSRACS